MSLCCVIFAASCTLFLLPVNAFEQIVPGAMEPLIWRLSNSASGIQPYGPCLAERDRIQRQTSKYFTAPRDQNNDAQAKTSGGLNDPTMSAADKHLMKSLIDMKAGSLFFGFPTVRLRSVDLRPPRLLSTMGETQCSAFSQIETEKQLHGQTGGPRMCHKTGRHNGGHSVDPATLLGGHGALSRSRQHAQVCLLPQRPAALETLLWPTTPALVPGEQLVTFLQPLGSGKEAEVWRVCIARGHGDPEDDSATQIRALKVFRRVFDYPAENKNVPKIPEFSVSWTKALKSLTETVGYLGVLSQETTLLPDAVWDVASRGIASLPKAHHEALTRYTLYLGFGATFDVADADLPTYVRSKHNPFSVRETACIGRQVLEALLLMDAVGLVWMDCKPSNLLIFGNAAKVGDIGFLRPKGQIMRGPGIGTPGFRPFDAFRKHVTVDEGRAVFALGVTLYWMLTQCLPWKEATMKAKGAKLMAQTHWSSGLSHENISSRDMAFLETLLHPNPKERATLHATASHPFWTHCRGI